MYKSEKSKCKQKGRFCLHFDFLMKSKDDRHTWRPRREDGRRGKGKMRGRAKGGGKEKGKAGRLCHVINNWEKN